MNNQNSKKPNRTPKTKLLLPKRCEEDSALLMLLKKYNLQQYYKNLADKGYDQNLKSLITLTDSEFESLLDTIKFFPGHRSKFVSIINLMRKLQIKDTPKRRRSSSNHQNLKEKIKRPGSCKNKGKRDTPRLKKMFEENGCKSNSDSYHDLEQELEEAQKKIKELTNLLAVNTPSPVKEIS